MTIHFLTSIREDKKLSPWVHTLFETLAAGFTEAKIDNKLITTGPSFAQRHFGCIYTLLKNNSYSKHIVSDDSILSNPLISILCKFFGGKHVIIHHGIIYGRQLKYIRMYHPTNIFLAYLRRMTIFFSLMFADEVWANSDNTKFRARVVGKNEKRIHALHLPVMPLANSKTIEKEGKLHQESTFQQCVAWVEQHPDRSTLINVNAIVDHKHPEHLLQALQHVTTPCTVIFVGPKKAPYLFRKMLTLAKKLSATTHHKIFFLDSLPNLSLEWLRSKSTLGIQPSMNEGFGLTPLELGRHAITTVAMDININREIQRDSVIYYNAKKRHSHQQFAQVIQNALENPDLLKKQGLKAKENVARFNLDNIIKGAIEAFKFTASDHQTSSTAADQPASLEKTTVTNHENQVKIQKPNEVALSAKKPVADKNTLESKKTNLVTNKPSAAVKPTAAKQEVKPAVKPAVKVSAVKQAPKVTVPTTEKKTSPKPAAKPAVKSAAAKPAVKSVAAAKPAVKPEVKVSAVKQGPKVTVPTTEKKTSPKPAAKPAVKSVAAAKQTVKPEVKVSALKQGAKVTVPAKKVQSIKANSIASKAPAKASQSSKKK